MGALPDPAAVRAVLCDADGNLFPSEEPAFDASAVVTNRLMAELGTGRRLSADELRRATTGLNFRTTAVQLAAGAGVRLDGERLERWVAVERDEVTAHLARTLRPDPEVLGPLTALAGRFVLAAVSSSARSRLDACFLATGLDGLLAPERRFSAEDSLPVPTSKPDPAIYQLAGRRLGVVGDQAVAVEDSIPGVRSAVSAGFPTVANVQFVAPAERSERIAALQAAGAAAVVESWQELADRLLAVAPSA